MRGAFALAVSVAVAMAQEPIVREGADWVQVTGGVVPGNPSGMLHVVTEGDLQLRGSSDGRITYILKKRVRAATLREAERLLRAFDVRVPAGGAAASILVMGPRGPVHSAELIIEAPSSLTAVLETLGGNLSATGMSGELHAETRAGRIELDRLGGGASVRTGGGEVWAGRVNGGLRCYSGGGNIRVEAVGRESWLETAGGDIEVRESGAALHAATVGGNIRVGRCAAEVFARTGAGVIEVREARGLVTADNSGGSIQIDSAKGVRCESGGGAIRLRGVDGGPLRATTASGNILAELLAGARIADSLLSTNAGDVTVFLSSNMPLTVQARSESGGGRRGIISDFPQIRIRRSGAGDPPGLVAEGALNGGGPVLRIDAAGGTIYLRRQK